MKQRFSSLDVKVITQELASELVSLRVSNIYDLSSRIFLFKFAKPDHRRQLIVDSGFRTHVTHYSRTAATTPSPFVTRLRKFLKSRRVTSVTQIGTDRVIDISFSDGAYHMFLEFFAGGNIIVTDREHTIISLFRQVNAAEGEEAKLGIQYNVTNKQNYAGIPDITPSRITETIEKAQALFAQDANAPKKKTKKNTDMLRKALSQGFPEFPPLLLDHAFAVVGLDAATPLDQALASPDILQKVREVLDEAERISKSFDVGESHAGYIVAKEDTQVSSTQTDGESESKTPGLLYEDFHPFKPRQFADKPGVKILEFERFNATVDEYFSSLESQRLESRLTEREQAAKRKLDAVRDEHRKRIDALKDAQELHIRKAAAIEDNVYRVQEAMDAVNGLVAQGMDWGEIARLIEMEQSRGNPVAQIIKLPLKLYENTVTLLLGEGDEEEEDEDLESSDESESDSDSEAEEKEDQKRTDVASKMLSIDIDLGLTPWANAKQYYEQKKQASEKQQRTVQSSTKALKSHEKKVTADLKKNLKQEKQVLRQAREPFWFEKFVFFISSEGYLVLGARDAMQSEMLYRRYLKKGDIFIHADLDGALPLVVKNRSGDSNAPISPSTLSQAGNLCVASSIAWDSKAVMSAYWAHAHQVSKTSQTGGGMLPTGAFEIKGEKNFLAPSQLVLGFSILFQISKESLKNHKIHFDAADTPATVTATATETETQESQEDAEKEEDRTEIQEDAEKQENVSEDEEEDDNDAEGAAANPLQRGDSELPPTNAEQSEPEAESASEDEELEAEVKAEVDQDLNTEDAEEAEQPEEETASNIQEAAPTEQEDQKLSARERRTLRQGKPIDRPGQAEPAPVRTAPTRAKRAKEKRAAAKYAHQDDDERELALRLLGAGKGKTAKAAQAAEAKAQRERELEAQTQRRRAQHERAAAAEQKRQAQFAEGGDDYNEDTAAAEAADLSWLPALVGNPTPDDEILAAIPVCAPWGALGKYKYKVKLQPGAVKKGKAVKEIIGRWVSETTTGKVKKDHAEDVGISRADAERLRSREGELIKGWKDSEVINSMPVGKVRIMTAGTGGGGGGGDKGKGKGGGGKGGGKGGKGGKKK
ncbi:hypothetical protein N7466_009513 [Penicillium verhagenii]|uniref:uncharacterized protein n=1 Tax=Penicillium verhagenii TaxID=1562060 RepID=UPI0025455A9E|nr:uncharacterized protein N7466_009513 [Penicillium verhagenii]KAJ5921187.1 hypothetical protein N7466_009513 [Penicillium verhagenii]